MVELFGVQNYWVCSVELITTLKEGVIINMLSIKTDDNFDINFEIPMNKCPTDERVDATLSLPMVPIPYLSRLAQATQDVIDTLGSLLSLILYENSSRTSSWNTGAFVETTCMKSKILKDKKLFSKNYIYKASTICMRDGKHLYTTTTCLHVPFQT